MVAVTSGRPMKCACHHLLDAGAELEAPRRPCRRARSATSSRSSTARRHSPTFFSAMLDSALELETARVRSRTKVDRASTGDDRRGVIEPRRPACRAAAACSAGLLDEVIARRHRRRASVERPPARGGGRRSRRARRARRASAPAARGGARARTSRSPHTSRRGSARGRRGTRPPRPLTYPAGRGAAGRARAAQSPSHAPRPARAHPTAAA